MRAFRNGFTLIEIVSTLVVLGVLALVFVAFFRNDDMGAYVERDKLLGQLVYARAQGMAMGGGQCVEVADSGVTFPVKRKENTFPAGALASYGFASGVRADSISFCFDAAGSACTVEDLEDSNGTGILYCVYNDFERESFIVFLKTNSGGKGKLEVSPTGFVQ